MRISERKFESYEKPLDHDFYEPNLDDEKTIKKDTMHQTATPQIVRFKLRSEYGYVYLTNNPTICNHALTNYYCRILFILIIQKILYTNPNIRYITLQISL